MVLERPLVLDDKLPSAEAMMDQLLEQVQRDVQEAEQLMSSMLVAQQDQLERRDKAK